VLRVVARMEYPEQDLGAGMMGDDRRDGGKRREE
jgi:hypothetical protein